MATTPDNHAATETCPVCGHETEAPPSAGTACTVPDHYGCTALYSGTLKRGKVYTVMGMTEGGDYFLGGVQGPFQASAEQVTLRCGSAGG